MWNSWRLQLREVEASLRAGRLDEAHRLLVQESLARTAPGKKLANRVATEMARRAVLRVCRGDERGGWQDLESAECLGDGGDTVEAARQQMIHQTATAAERELDRGEFSRAIRRLETLRPHAEAHPKAVELMRVSQRLQSASHLMERGKYADAEEQLEQAKLLQPSAAVIDERLAACREAKLQSGEVDQQANADHGEEIRLTRADDGRVLLWVDGVGGYLVCWSPQVVLGLAVSGSEVDVPIRGDVARRHACIRREDGYWIEPWQPVSVNGQLINQPRALVDGDNFEMGRGVRFRFRQPHALSSTARLEPLSGHRTQPYTDGILLMAEACVLGPKWHSHVVCRGWQDDVVLYRSDGDLYCRAMTPIEIDGKFCEMQGRVHANAHVAGNDFSLCLEQVA